MKNTKPTAKQYREPCGRLGGNLNDIPRPHYRKWPTSKEPRKIDVRISTYAIVGGTHYYIDIIEEDNPVWDSRTEAEQSPELYNDVLAKGLVKTPESIAHWSSVVGWTRPWTDKAGAGRTYHGRFSAKTDALKFIEKVLNRYRGKNYRFTYDYTRRASVETALKLIKSRINQE